MPTTSRWSPPAPSSVGASLPGPPLVGGPGGAPLGRPAAGLLLLDLALELPDGALEMAAHGRGGDPLGYPAEEARPGDTVGQAQLHVGAAARAPAQPPAPALI